MYMSQYIFWQKQEKIKVDFPQYPDLATNRIGKTATSSEIFSIISQVYSEFRVSRSALIEKGNANLQGGPGNVP
jgi:hypothetical protein